MEYLKYADAILTAVGGGAEGSGPVVVSDECTLTHEEAVHLRASPSQLLKPIMKLFNGMSRGALLRRYVSEQMAGQKVLLPSAHL